MPLRPLVWTFWIVSAAALLSARAFLFFTCRREIIGAEHLASSRSVIICAWHVSIIPFLVAYRRFDRPMVQLVNGAWYMWPINWLSGRMGMHRHIPVMNDRHGQEALAEIIRHLGDGYSTPITPDGPSGPPRKLRKGVLHLALQSGSPIVPMQAEAKCAWTWTWSWDQKRIPLPFSKVVVRYSAPIFVTAETLEADAKRLAAALG